jgi:phage terminase large subunit GpA-like protein
VSNVIIRKEKKSIAEEIYQMRQVEYVISRIEELPEEIHIPLPSEWTEENRYYPTGTSKHYGKHDWSLVPHLRQPLDDCHPDAPYTHITNMKSVQSANTVTLAENAMGFFIKYMLGSILFLTSTKNMAGIRGSANIDVMIDNSGLIDHLKPSSNRTGRKTKDNVLYKEFMGNIKLLMSSYESIADLKSNTFDLIIEDELDEAKAELKDQGDIEGIIEGRTMGLDIYKILQISTSSRAETSRINRNFLLGDQNEYAMPCPECGETQYPVLKGKGLEYGMTATTEISKKTGKKRIIPETVRYICKHCGKDFYEYKKRWMLNNGIWVPQSEPEDRKRRSYHSPGLISPFLGWERIFQEFMKSKFGKDLPVFKNFTINYLGNPWMSVQKAADWEKLKDRAEDYIRGTVPEGKNMMLGDMNIYVAPLVLFGGCDVHGDRLELLVKGLGANGEEWMIDYQIFYGTPGNINDGCWRNLRDFVYSHTYRILGSDYNINCTAIDCGWDPRKGKREKDFVGKANIVYEFCAQQLAGWFIPVMGVPDDKESGIIKEARISDPGTPITKRYNVFVSSLKESLMNRIDQTEGYGTVHVPRWENETGVKREIGNEWFRQFLSERYQEDPKKPGTYGWFKIYQRNEPLDTWNYATAAAAFKGVLQWTNWEWIDRYNSMLEAGKAG